MKTRIKEVVKRRGLTLKSIADKLSITRQGLQSRIVNNTTIDKIQEIADVIGCDLIELIEPSDGYTHSYRPDGEWLGIIAFKSSRSISESGDIDIESFNSIRKQSSSLLIDSNKNNDWL